MTSTSGLFLPNVKVDQSDMMEQKKLNQMTREKRAVILIITRRDIKPS